MISALGISALGLGSSFLASPALAVTQGDCGAAPTGGTLTLSGSVCTLTFGESGTYSFTTPSAVTDFAALLVGGGGGALVADATGYAGNGGKVTYVPLGADGAGKTFTISVGAAGASSASAPTAGTATSLTYDSPLVTKTAAGGDAGSQVSYCSLNGSYSTYVGVGNGAGGNSLSTNGEACSAGPGVDPGAVANDSDGLATPSLFRDYGVSLGNGGSLVGVTSPLPSLTAGSGASIIMDTALTVTTGHDTSGGAGLVVFRWPAVSKTETPSESPSKPETPIKSLANTGSDNSSLIGIAGIAVIFGALMNVVRRRAKGRHRA